MIRCAAIIVLLGMAGCVSAAQKAEERDDLLATAGFSARTADTPRKIAFLKSLPSHKFVVKTINGQPVYLYADPLVCRCIYFGHEDNWNRYQRERFDAGIAARKEEIAGLNEMIQYNGDDWGYF